MKPILTFDFEEYLLFITFIMIAIHEFLLIFTINIAEKNERLKHRCKSSLFILINTKGRGQNLERRNIERPMFRNYKIANIKITNDEFGVVSFLNLFFHFL